MTSPNIRVFLLPLLLCLAGCSPNAATQIELKNHAVPITPNSIHSGSSPMKKVFSISADAAQTQFAEARRRGMPADGLLLIADTASQRATLINATGILLDYPMSSSKYGNGSQVDSNKTPLGWHKVLERIGGDELQGRSFTSRVPDNILLGPEQWRSTEGRDFVLTRILWLTGLEPGINAGGNVDSHERCIYIHGTNQEHLLGKPASHGCLRLSNRDVMELFDLSEGRQLFCLIR